MRIKHETIAILFIYIFFIILLCSGLSPIIKEYYSDLSYYVYAGRIIQKGMLPYVDFNIIPNKGIYMYFFNSIGAFLTPNSTFGNMVVEFIYTFINVLLVYKISFEIEGDKERSFKTSILMLVMLMSRFSYIFGAQIEQQQLIFQLLSILLLVKYYLRKIETYPPIFMFFQGVFVACIFNMKMNYILCFVPIALIILFKNVREKRIDLFWKNIVFGCCGVFVGMLPAVLYLYYNNLIQIYIDSCFSGAIAGYGSPITIKTILNFFFQPKTIWMVPIEIASVVIVAKSKIAADGKIMYLLMFSLSCFSAFMSGGTFAVYHYHLYVYFIPFVYYASQYINIKEKKFIAISFLITIFFNLNLVFKYLIPSDYKATPFKVMKSIENHSSYFKNYSQDDYFSTILQFYVVNNITNDSIDPYFDRDKKIWIFDIKGKIESEKYKIITLTIEEGEKYKCSLINYNRLYKDDYFISYIKES